MSSTPHTPGDGRAGSPPDLSFGGEMETDDNGLVTFIIHTIEILAYLREHPTYGLNEYFDEQGEPPLPALTEDGRGHTLTFYDGTLVCYAYSDNDVIRTYVDVEDTDLIFCLLPAALQEEDASVVQIYEPCEECEDVHRIDTAAFVRPDTAALWIDSWADA